MNDGLTLRLVIISDEDEMGLGSGLKMKHKIHEDDAENFNTYDIKKVTRAFTNFADGNMWKSIINE